MILAGVIYKIYHDFSGAIYILVPRVLRTLGTNKQHHSEQPAKFSIITILAGMIYKIYHDFSGAIYILVPRVLRTLGTNKGGGVEIRLLFARNPEKADKRYYSEFCGFSSNYHDFSGVIIPVISPLKS